MSELDDLVRKARQSPSSSPGRINAQRRSYVLGSAALEHLPLTRSTIISEMDGFGSPVSTPLPLIVEAQNLTKQYDFIVEYVRNHPDPRAFRLEESLIQKIHTITFAGLPEHAGHYRQTAAAIAGNADYVAPSATEIPRLMAELCSYVNRNWAKGAYLHLGAYVLWRLLWIHPFTDGNGRVARAFSYLVICLMIGALLPGTPTLPELIMRNRREYYAALEHADKAEKAGAIDLSRMELLLGKLLTRQLSNSPQLSETVELELQKIIELRITLAPEAIRKQCFGSAELDWRLWSLGEYLTLNVSAPRSFCMSWKGS
jgi:Fic family protein